MSNYSVEHTAGTLERGDTFKPFIYEEAFCDQTSKGKKIQVKGKKSEKEVSLWAIPH